ncbi:MAG: 3-hydroxylacyl-ACP dehydratase [Myxococcota bacterium]|nr:3-hydroxylacyl-ACP dehydratase [Myxococcota bacterium]
MGDAFPPLTAFMPHRAPMLLLDRMIACTDTEATCTKTLRSGDLFVEDGGITTLVALELFAQTAAAHFGYLGLSRGSGFASGALLGTRKLELVEPRIAVGDELEIRVTQVMSMPPAAQYECVLLRGGETIAKGTINVAMGTAEMAR